MTREKIAQTLFKTAGIGFASGLVGAVWLYINIIQNAEARMQEVGEMSRASYMCAAGSAATLFACLSPPAGAIFGFCLGGFFLWRKTCAARRPLP